ncbi:MAG: DegT/DnrJ/EryC1/StrS family aminotransferase [Candidatus Hinthialibacter antarcticus]|nr:DegT/DnrJ/EryC1/StrS family aminotransferase [Candidatus Hinthialibacter antarcticus]
MVEWKISLFEPDLTRDDEEAAVRPIRERWLTMGEATREFEDAFALRIGAKHAIAVSSGTAALHLALMAVGVGPGDKVMLPSLTFCGCANSVRVLGATPVFVDIVSERDWSLSPADMQDKLTDDVRAVMPVHYAGFACQMDDILPVAQTKKISIIEDCAHALVTESQGTYCGCFGAVGCFSFFTNKNMTTGEGGMATTNDDELAEKLRRLRSHGMTTLTLDRYKGRAISYDVTSVGLNYRLDEIRSRIGLSQLGRLDENLNKRKRVYAWYLEQLLPVDEIIIPFQDRNPDGAGLHIFPIALPKSINRTEFINTLKADGIQTSIHYPPIHQFSAYSDFRDCNCPLTEDIASREVTLPFYPQMTKDDVENVCASIKSALVALR